MASSCCLAPAAGSVPRAADTEVRLACQSLPGKRGQGGGRQARGRGWTSVQSQQRLKAPMILQVCPKWGWGSELFSLWIQWSSDAPEKEPRLQGWCLCSSQGCPSQCLPQDCWGRRSERNIDYSTDYQDMTFNGINISNINNYYLTSVYYLPSSVSYNIYSFISSYNSMR